MAIRGVEVTTARTQRELEVQRVGYLLKVLPVTVLVCAGLIIASTQRHFAALLVCVVFLAQNILANRLSSLVSHERARYIDAGRYSLNVVAILVLTLTAGHMANPWLLALPPIAGAPVYFVQTCPTALAQLALTVGACVGVAVDSGNLQTALVPFVVLSVVASMSTSITVYLSRTSEHLLDALQQVGKEVRERKRVEQELRTVHAELEQRVENRTVELSLEVRERQRAEKRAVEANQVKSMFLANMSHELRTPLNAVLGYAELIDEEGEELTQQTRDDLSNIHVAATHLLSLIEDILDLSKVEAGRMELEYVAIDVEELVREVEVTVAPLAAKNRNILHCVCTPKMRSLQSDRMRLKQILLNLVSNACKFTRDGVIEVRARHLALAGAGTFEFTITDTGIGIAPEALEGLFQPFTQADSSTTRKYGGTGLGLALSRRLARILGGDISVQSIVGKGSTFKVYIQAQPEASEELIAS